MVRMHCGIPTSEDYDLLLGVEYLFAIGTTICMWEEKLTYRVTYWEHGSPLTELPVRFIRRESRGAYQVVEKPLEEELGIMTWKEMGQTEAARKQYEKIRDWKAENEAKICMRFGEVKSSSLEHVELLLELSSSSTTTRKSFLVNGGEEAKDAEEEEEEVQQVSERAPTLPSRTTSAPRIRVTPQQCHESLHVPAAEEEGRRKRRIQAPNRLIYKALGKPAKSALAGAALIVGDDEESDYDECAFAFFSPVEMLREPATLKEALESSDAEEWKKAMESELKSIEENGTWELVELPEGRNAITSKWLFKIKSDADGNIARYKSRLVAKGYHQKE
ncbi:unnamed protein product [Closterium sp. NIES-53]